MLVQPQRLKIIVPSFTLAVPIWAGASTILKEFPVGNDYYFTLKRPVKSFGSSFVAAISYIQEGIVVRFKLWDDAKAILYYPVYAGDIIGPEARMEIWSINSALAPTLAAAKSLESSVLAFQTLTCQSCCSNPDANLALTAQEPTNVLPYNYCNPFCDTLIV